MNNEEQHVHMGITVGNNLLRTLMGFVTIMIALAPAAETQFAAKAKAAESPLRVVCFGDSVTGVYYHTGSRRAYTDMVEIGLRRVYPTAEIAAVNAGISGHTTADGLARIDGDVLAHEPDLVTVMFGLNDMTRVSLEDYRANLKTIIGKCEGVGAEVMLCTPNAVRTSAGRPVEKLEEYVAAVREVAGEEGVQLIDCYDALLDLQETDPMSWAFMMSDDIHPNMDGHKYMAREIVTAITGEDISLGDVQPIASSIPNTIARLEAGESVEILAMPPYDTLLESAIQEVWPDSNIAITAWRVAGKSLSEIEAESKKVRAEPPHLVFLAVPAAASAASPDAFIQRYSWILNYSIQFGQWQWDCVAVPPSLTKRDLNNEERIRDGWARQLIRAQDIGTIETSGEDLADRLVSWLREQRTAHLKDE